MNLSLFARGLLIGFSIAAPVGPIGVLCIRRTLTQGQLAGLLSGLGAATADAIYGAIAAYGLTLISAILIGQAGWFRLVGGLFLIYLGVQTFLAQPATVAASSDGKIRAAGLWGAYLSTILLTLTNPATIMSFAAVFAGLGLASSSGDPLAATVTVLGVFLGSALWWLLLSGGVSLFRASFSKTNSLQWVNRGSGIVLIAFGSVALASLLRG
ncbi:LysE family transporter [Thermoleptolyngbya sp. C42_A2020_037]|uniref:LysE/ArgO family amino acid transporter n=1 Tax=Thermoleptolyngbya sp. C42_A2020_037 TaxID=2747799 RepID=UPI0019DE9DD6|nr:LysE family transporter [Thermoleptolyngbya sp. C42_A2020_037]MBF2086560.1 LysE family transporter [Thermoleptolyngbya sp. C42_A2020_037]